MSKQLYGFYSEKGAKLGGTSIYATPDGKEVEVSCVDENPSAPEYKWDDKVYVGPVTRWIRTAQRGEFQFLASCFW